MRPSAPGPANAASAPAAAASQAGHRVAAEPVAGEPVAHLADGAPGGDQRGHPELLHHEVVDQLADLPVGARRGAAPLVRPDRVHPLAELVQRPPEQPDDVLTHPILRPWLAPGSLRSSGAWGAPRCSLPRHSPPSQRAARMSTRSPRSGTPSARSSRSASPGADGAGSPSRGQPAARAPHARAGSSPRRRPGRSPTRRTPPRPRTTSPCRAGSGRPRPAPGPRRASAGRRSRAGWPGRRTRWPAARTALDHAPRHRTPGIGWSVPVVHMRFGCPQLPDCDFPSAGRDGSIRTPGPRSEDECHEQCCFAAV